VESSRRNLTEPTLLHIILRTKVFGDSCSYPFRPHSGEKEGVRP
jgi:hypothetical protein